MKLPILINSKLGNIRSLNIEGRLIDWLPLEWYETGKRMQRKITEGGQELILKFLDNPPAFSEGDLLLLEDDHVVAVNIIPCECLVIPVSSMFEMASLAYEIGNKHLPLFFENDCLLVPMDLPLSRLLTAQGYMVINQSRKLLQPLKTTVTPHGATSGGSLFSRIMQLTNPEK